SLSTCSSAPWTAATCIKMSTQYASLSTIRWSPCTCPSIRRSRPRTLAFVSSLITPIPPGGSIPLRDRGVNSTGGGSRAVTGAGAVVTGSQVEERRLFRGREGRAPRRADGLVSPRRALRSRGGRRAREAGAPSAGASLNGVDAARAHPDLVRLAGGLVRDRLDRDLAVDDRAESLDRLGSVALEVARDVGMHAHDDLAPRRRVGGCGL